MWYVTKSDIDIAEVDIFLITETEPSSFLISFDAGDDNLLFSGATAIAKASLITSGNGLRVLYADAET